MTDLQCDELIALHLNDGHESVSVDESVQYKLNEIKKDYESIFSWDIYNRAGSRGDIISNIIETIEEKCDEFMEIENDFSLHKFYYKLITSFEYYNSANYKKSLSEIEGVMKSLDSCTFDNSFEEYKNSFNHIARSTYAYIFLSMNINSTKVKIFENIVPISGLSRDEKAAICAIKAYVFIEYAPVGNEIALEYAHQARGLCPDEPEWINVWLIAKGRVRRYFHNLHSRPDENEINAADTLLRVKNQKADFLMQASSVYLEIAKNSKREKYFRRAAEIMSEALMLDNNDIAQLNYCFTSYIYLTEKYCSQPLIDEILEKLQNVNYCYVNLTLGKYYFSVKNYEKAKEYFSRGMISGSFHCTIQLLRVECYLQPVEQFPFVQTLNKIYDVFVNPKRRLIVLVQALIYCCYFDNPKEVMRYLKLYMDQDISDEMKKRELTRSWPFFNYPGKYRKGYKFLYVLTTYVEHLSNHNCWDTEEKKINADTLNRFNKMRQIVTPREFCENNKKNIRENNEYNGRFNKQHQGEKDEKSNCFKNQDRPLTKQFWPTDETTFCENSKKNVHESNWRFNKQQKHESDKNSSLFKIKQNRPSTSQTEPIK